MSADALLNHADDPGFLAGYGPIPAEAARALVADNLEAGAKVWLKRLFVRPETGELIAMDSRSRLFPKALGEFLDLRGRWCRTPWCDAPIRHHDHIRSHALGGPTGTKQPRSPTHRHDHHTHRTPLPITCTSGVTESSVATGTD